MLVEALILERLSILPKRRHQDWMRSLLVQGFLAESRVFRQLKGTAADYVNSECRAQQPAGPGFNLAGWLGRTAQRKPPAGANHSRQCESEPRAVAHNGMGKPFAHLRKVVG
jgi:hypothetical protein